MKQIMYGLALLALVPQAHATTKSEVCKFAADAAVQASKDRVNGKSLSHSWLDVRLKMAEIPGNYPHGIVKSVHRSGYKKLTWWNESKLGDEMYLKCMESLLSQGE